jgi:hypothetical protein
MTGALAALGVTLLIELPIVAVAYAGQRGRECSHLPGSLRLARR